MRNHFIIALCFFCTCVSGGVYRTYPCLLVVVAPIFVLILIESFRINYRMRIL